MMNYNKTFQWFGHMVLTGEDRKSKYIMKTRSEGRRNRGRRRKSYTAGNEDTVRKNGRSDSIGEDCCQYKRQNKGCEA